MDKESTSKSDDSKKSTDCPVCLQPLVQPVKLPCDHVFCFLCANGLVRQTMKCALCRKDIPSNFVNSPQFVVQQPSASKSDSYQWYYQGKSGWWQYDDQTSGQIEHAYQNDEERCEVLIAGQIYIIDFEKDRQILKSNPIRSRHIKRDLDTIPCKGVAGVRASLSCKTTSVKNNDSVQTASPSNLSDNFDCRVIVPKLELSTISVNLVTSNIQNVSVPSNSNSSCSIKDNLPYVDDPKTLADQVFDYPVKVELTDDAVSDEKNSEVTDMRDSDSILDVKPDLSTLLNSVQTQPTITNTEQNMKESQSFDTCTRLQNTFVDYSGKQLSKRSLADVEEQNENEDPSSDLSPCTKRFKCNNLECIQHNLKNSFGVNVVSKLQEMSQIQKLYAEKIINDALFNGLLGKLTENSYISS